MDTINSALGALHWVPLVLGYWILASFSLLVLWCAAVEIGHRRGHAHSFEQIMRRARKETSPSPAEEAAIEKAKLLS